LFGVDIEGSTRRTDPIKRELRRSMYGMFEQALCAGGLTQPALDPFVDRGDGVLALIHPIDSAPKTVLFGKVVPVLAALLAEHNARNPRERYRLRAVVHAGEVNFDDRSCFGETVDVACRLLDSEAAKRALQGTSAPMVLVVSDDVHRCIVRHGHDGIDPKAFSRIPLPPVLGLERPGWVRVVEAAERTPRRIGGVTRMDAYRRQA
jgi:hypothetical protein